MPVMLHWWLPLPSSVSFGACQACVPLIFTIPASHSCLILIKNKNWYTELYFHISYIVFCDWMIDVLQWKNLPDNHNFYGSTFLNLNMVLLLCYSGSYNTLIFFLLVTFIFHAKLQICIYYCCLSNLKISCTRIQ